MPSTRSRTSYSGIAKAFHWLTAIVVVVAFIYGPGGSETQVYAPERDFERQLHETLGLSIFIVSLLRIGWRAFDQRPAPEPVSRWMGIVAKTMQHLLYALLLLVPMTAITGALLQGHAVTWLGGSFGPWAMRSQRVGSLMVAVHRWLGDATLWVAGLHAVAALYHHFMLKDGVLRSMLPFANR